MKKIIFILLLLTFLVTISNAYSIGGQITNLEIIIPMCGVVMENEVDPIGLRSSIDFTNYYGTNILMLDISGLYYHKILADQFKLYVGIGVDYITLNGYGTFLFHECAGAKLRISKEVDIFVNFKYMNLEIITISGGAMYNF
jgi:hypothetical protein